MVDEFRQTPGIEPLSAPESHGHIERRQTRREPPKTLADAHAIVQSISKRRIDENPQVKSWRLIKQVTYLFVLVGVFLMYYYTDTMNEALSLLGIRF